MQEVASTDFYRLAVDKRKKRVYNTVFGTWGERPDASRFVRDWEEVFNQITAGYTVLTDASEFRLLSAEWAATTIKTRQRLIAAGITKIAEILPENMILKMQFDTISERTDVQTKIFSNHREAEAWLDHAEPET
jgi:hypothetical protein